MLAVIGQGSGGSASESCCMPPLMKVRSSAAEGLLLQVSQGTQATACVCERERRRGGGGRGAAGKIERDEKMKGGRVTETQGEGGRGVMTTGDAHVTCNNRQNKGREQCDT